MWKRESLKGDAGTEADVEDKAQSSGMQAASRNWMRQESPLELPEPMKAASTLILAPWDFCDSRLQNCMSW